ncbi:MAG: aspartate--tRNA ligase [Candidatus Moraniibacteriota bacterium]
MTRTLVSETPLHVGETISLSGWVSVRRDHGKLIFIDFRDESGEVQMVVLPNHPEAQKMAQEVRPEWVIRVQGQVNRRPEKLINTEQPNGTVEIEVIEVEVLSKSLTPPFDVLDDGRSIGEGHRLKYRYLDLRRPRMQRNIRMRHRVIHFVRNFLTQNQFVEIETPLLSKSTPEGSRDYIVPSRLDKGKFYALPQSPQQYKQLLMASGFEKYFQIARCMRDEDTRGDRQPEFTQLDMEMSFIGEEDIMTLNEKLLIELVETLLSEKKIQTKPFPRISYREAMEKYGNDKPDIRTDKNDPNLLAFCWIVDFPQFEKTSEGKWTFTHNPFSAPKPEHIGWLMKGERVEEIQATQYDIVLNGFEIGGGSIRAHQPEVLAKTFEIMGYAKEEIQANFGHMLEAFERGTPPHGGIAWGMDRLMAILMNEPNIREVIAFAKTGEGQDLLMQAPSEVSPLQLSELGLALVPKTKKED